MNGRINGVPSVSLFFKYIKDSTGCIKHSIGSLYNAHTDEEYAFLLCLDNKTAGEIVFYFSDHTQRDDWVSFIEEHNVDHR